MRDEKGVADTPVPRPIILRLPLTLHRYEAGEDPRGSANATVSLAGLLSPSVGTVTAAVELTLPASLPLADVPPRTYHAADGSSYTVPVLPPPPAGPGLLVQLGPMDIRTFLLTVEPQGPLPRASPRHAPSSLL